MESFVIGFKIFDARSLQTEDGNPCDCFVVVQCVGCPEPYQSEVKENKQALAPFNESCIWPDVQLYPKAFDAAFIEFQVYARNWFTRNYLIGKASLQLSFINRRKGHLYSRKWLCLRREDSTEVTGMLNITVFALKPGEQAPSARAQEEVADDDGEEDKEGGQADNMEDLGTAVLKSQIEAPPGKPHYVKINIHRIEDLGGRDATDLPSFYLTVEFCGVVLSTPTASNVKQYTFNETLQIPVITPVYEDTIIIKLWRAPGYFWGSQLMAQGLVSFAELRNAELKPTWFNLYGWDSKEIDSSLAPVIGSNLESILATGKPPDTNTFIGRLLLSGSVERVSDDDEVQPAKSKPARAVDEPPMRQVVLFPDVFLVTGDIEGKCQVEVTFGNSTGSTEQVSASEETLAAQSKLADAGQKTEEADGDQAVTRDEGSNKIFNFTEKQGRIQKLLVMSPEDTESQPFVMINVYSICGTLSESVTRVGFAKKRLSEFPVFEAGNPKQPTFVALTPMPGQEAKRCIPSVLLSIEQSPKEEVRHSRKNIKLMVYVVRAYCFMARQIEYTGKQKGAEPSRYSLRVMCAGAYQETTTRDEDGPGLKGPRPLWMEPLDLKVVLYSSSTKEAPTIEPIVITLVEKRDSMFSSADVDLGKAICIYTQMRRKNALDKWNPFSLAPQWIKVFGGQHGSQCMGEVLIAFELMLWKNRDAMELRPKDMWPAREQNFSPGKHLCKLRKATLHFTLYGLRDMFPVVKQNSLYGTGLIGLSDHVQKPVVTVEVSKFHKIALDEAEEELHPASRKAQVELWDKVPNEEEAKKKGVLMFQFAEMVEGGDPRVQNDKFKKWESKCGHMGEKEGMNYEYFQVGKLQVEIPDKMLLQPYIRIKVWESPQDFLLTSNKGLVAGESMQSLANLLPCCWLPGVSLEKSFADQKMNIEEGIDKAKKESEAKAKYRAPEEESADEVKSTALAVKADADGGPGIMAEEKVPDKIDSFAMPAALRDKDKEKRPLKIMPAHVVNMQREMGFTFKGALTATTQEGDQQEATDTARKNLAGKLENEPENDFWFRNVPLLKGQDIIEMKDENVDWNFQPTLTYGFVKCTFKLVDGWEEEPQEEDEDDPALQSRYKNTALAQTDDDDKKEDDLSLLKRSYTAYFSQELNKYAFDTKQLNKKYKSNLPSRIRCRLYLVKAVVIYGKAAGELADPYVAFQLGKDISVTMRNMACPNTNTPEFYRVEERDIVLPNDSRLEIKIMDLDSDLLIGSTVVDLEDRWHSKITKDMLTHGAPVPCEQRSLFSNRVVGRNFGSLEMWIELLDSVYASDHKVSDLTKPKELELELRLVIWDTTKVKLVKEDYVNVKLKTALDCKEFQETSPYYRQQETDVHFISKDGNAIFNWRMVYPKIKMPTKACTMQVGLMHHELLGETDIGFLDLDLKKYLEKVAKDGDAVVIDKSVLTFYPPDSTGNPDEDVLGTVTVSMWVMTQAEADGKKAGLGREEPNEHPQLITPIEGRDWGSYLSSFGFSLPDFGLWKKLIPLFVAMIVFLVLAIVLKQIGLF